MGIGNFALSFNVAQCLNSALVKQALAHVFRFDGMVCFIARPSDL